MSGLDSDVYISGLAFRFRLHVLDFRFRLYIKISNFICQLLYSRFPMSGFGFQVLDFRFYISGLHYQDGLQFPMGCSGLGEAGKVRGWGKRSRPPLAPGL